MAEIINRAEAKALGLRRYFTGIPCKRGHVCERRTSDKHCTECRKSQISDHYQNNREKYLIYSANRRKKNPDYFTLMKRKKEFNISIEEQLSMLSAQGNKCAICGCLPCDDRNLRRRQLCLDHCHDTGEVREFLCAKCNTAIGGFNDNPALLTAAADYLLRHQQ